MFLRECVVECGGTLETRVRGGGRRGRLVACLESRRNSGHAPLLIGEAIFEEIEFLKKEMRAS